MRDKAAYQAFLIKSLVMSQLQNLKRQKNSTGQCPELPLLDPNLSAAERLINYLQNQPDLSYTALFATAEMANVLVTIKKKKANMSTQQKQNKLRFKGLVMSTVPTTGEASTTRINADDLLAEGETDTPKSHTDRILGALTVTSEDGETRLLLAVAWVSDEQRRLAKCFPEAWGVDAAFGTNSEQRPLVSVTLKLSTNQTMTHFHAFLPCLTRWAFNWTFGTAMPMLLGKSTLWRNKAVCSDGEEKMYGPIVVLSQPGQVWEGTDHGLCMFHLVDRQLGPEGLKGQKLSPIGENYKSVIINWLYSFSDDTETHDEFDYSYNLLMSWLRTDELNDQTSPRKEGRLGPGMCDKWATFIETKIRPHKLKFVFAKRLKTRSFDLRTTSNTEG
jgi:hypothetical protein